jgi:hypothetical protein
VPLAAAEGFIRQILGWREYVRGVYWARMPGYAEPTPSATPPLPAWFWTGKTKMRCLADSIGQSLEHAYAHHIQRLMVIGNFALLAGLDPAEVHRWYLGIYIDAFEWVELPNTLGMSQFADGGLLATKPYVSSAAYIDRMGDYCKGCAYKAKARTATTPARSTPCTGISSTATASGWAPTTGWAWCIASWNASTSPPARRSASGRRPCAPTWTPCNGSGWRGSAAAAVVAGGFAVPAAEGAGEGALL